jgi:uncharacterized protein YbjT (DUF2867 family)
VILVTGATGKVGRHLVAGLVADGAKVRALTRDPDGAHLPAGVELVRGDSANPDGYAQAVAGTTAVFVNPAAVGGSAVDLMAAAKVAGTSQVVMLSSFLVRDDRPQDYSIGAYHKSIEAVVEDSGLGWTFLRCGGFAANTLSWAPMIRADGVVRAPYGQAATALIAERDIAAAAVRVLLDGGPAEAKYILTGQQSLTQIEQVDAIGRAIDRSLRFEEIPAEVFRQAAVGRIPASAVDDLLRYAQQYVGRTAEMWPDLETLIRRPATTFAEWATEHAASFR